MNKTQVKEMEVRKRENDKQITLKTNGNERNGDEQTETGDRNIRERKK